MKQSKIAVPRKALQEVLDAFHSSNGSRIMELQATRVVVTAKELLVVDNNPIDVLDKAATVWIKQYCDYHDMVSPAYTFEDRPDSGKGDPSMVEVSVRPLLEVLLALNGHVHQVRELLVLQQASTREGCGVLFDKTCITKLMEELEASA